VRAWLYWPLLALALAACQSSPTHLFTYSSQGVLIQAERLVSPFFGRAADPLPYGGPNIARPLRRMHERFAQLTIELDKGTVGLTEDGDVAIRDAGATTAELKQLVRAENRDRAVLYNAMSEAVGYPDGLYLPYVDASFAAEWQKQAPPGWWLRNEQGEWQRKP
jgi:hypothetical protein